jgi:hypothetical protein
MEVHEEEPHLRNHYSAQYLAHEDARPHIYLSGKYIRRWIEHQQFTGYARRGARIPVRHHTEEAGHLGVGIQIDMFNTNAKINAAAQVTGDGVHHDAVSASSSLFAPIPVAGPDVRIYVTNSPRLFVDANVLGMYLFGYGNFVSSAGDIGLTISKHFAVLGGYQLGSHLVVNGTSDRLGLRLIQKGAILGVQASF